MNGLLKFLTCGSVDDGKSTLIGHLLYDAKLLYADQEKSLELESKVGSRGGEIDYSLLLDGLMAEREQGITIDVAYRYFTTDRRSFICADTPGHEEYTRNMACGASFADLAVILVDASQGVLVQTRRHARICALMGIRYFVFAINKMDLVDYSKERFDEIKSHIEELKNALHLDYVIVIPVSATEGDNITKRSDHMEWYKGPVLLDYLETVDVGEASADEKGFYMPVQRVCRPNHTFRGFEGQIEHGTVKVGDNLRVLPSGQEAKVRSILVTDREASEAHTGQPVTIQLDREIDVSRGCVLEKDSGLTTSDTFETELLWMDDHNLEIGRNFIIRLGTKSIPGILTKILYKIDINTGEQMQASTLAKNEIAVCEIAVTEPIILDTFEHHRTMGELILIDRISNMTSACGIVTTIHLSGERRHPVADQHMRSALNWQVPYVITFRPEEDGTSQAAIEEAEFLLVRNGRHTYVYHPELGDNVENTVKCLYEAGIIVLLVLEAGKNVNLEKIANVKEFAQLKADPDKKDVTPSEISGPIFSLTSTSFAMDANNWVI